MWQKQNNELYKKFVFKDFKQAFSFMRDVAVIAEDRQHHPRWQNVWNTVEIWLSTHEADGITEKDTQLAAEIDDIFTAYTVLAKPAAAAPKVKEIKLFADGGSRGNPGPSAGGFALLDMDDTVLVANGKYLGITTNNQAEYHSLKGGLEAARQLGARIVHVYMDSLLVVNQMKGLYKVKNRDLWPIHEAIKELALQFEAVHYNHVRREYNKLADSLVNKTLDEQTR